MEKKIRGMMIGAFTLLALGAPPAQAQVGPAVRLASCVHFENGLYAAQIHKHWTGRRFLSISVSDYTRGTIGLKVELGARREIAGGYTLDLHEPWIGGRLLGQAAFIHGVADQFSVTENLLPGFGQITFRGCSGSFPG